MNCREAERLLDTFFDGELDGRLMRDAALHITRCDSCSREVREKERVHDLLNETIDRAVGAVDLDSLWASVQAHEDANYEQPAAVAEPRRAVGRRVGGRSVDGRSRPGSARLGRRAWPLAGVSAGAVAVGLVGLLLLTTDEGPDPMLALPGEPAAGAGFSPGAELAGGGESTGLPTSPGTSSNRARVVAAVSAPGPSPASLSPNLVALGPVALEAPLSSYGPRQVQAGPLQYSNHAEALWRQTLAR